MKTFSTALIVVLVILVLIAVGVFTVKEYSWVFSKRVKGQVVDVERVTDPTAVLGARATEAQMYSYSILIQGSDGHLYTSSSEDRQWQVVKKGYCVEALLFRYPPWHLEKANTFFNARLEGVQVCPGQTALPMEPAKAEAAPAVAPAAPVRSQTK